MRRQWTYCPVVGSEVEVLVSEPGRRGSGDAPTMLCLDVGRACTEAVCPICSVPPQVIRTELARLRQLAAD